MDEIDRAILSRLTANGRASHVLLGREVNLSPNAVADRVRRLIADGVITGIHAAVDVRALGRPMTALIDVRLTPLTTPDDFERTASELEAVQEIVFVTGRFDFQLRVACRDASDLDYVLRALRADGSVAETETRLALRDTIRRALLG